MFGEKVENGFILILNTVAPHCRYVYKEASKCIRKDFCQAASLSAVKLIQ